MDPVVWITTQTVNAVASGAGGLCRTLNLYVNKGGPKEPFDWKKAVYNVLTALAFGYFLGTAPVDSFSVGFAGNYVLTKGVTSVKNLRK